MSQSFPTIATDGSGQVLVDLPSIVARDLALQSMFSGAGAPSSPVNGQLWYDDTVPATPVIKQRVNGAWKKFLQSVSPCTFAAGALGGSASEYTPITGTARAVTVPSGNSGTLEIRNVVNGTGSITCEWRIGAGSWASVTVTTQRTFSDTNTIQFRVATGQGAAEYFYADVYDVDTNTFVRQAGFSWT